MKIFKIIIISNILLFLIGCDKNDENIFLKGNIVGFVNLVDETGNEVEDKSGANVSIEGLTSSANTNENGRFELSNVPAGTYNIIYNKTGYGSYKRFSFQFIGGNIPAMLYETTLYEQPKIEIQSLDISFNDNVINISGKITETSQYTVQAFFNDSSNVSNLNYDYASYRYSFCCIPTTQFSQSIYLSETPYSLGDKVYLVIYFINPNEKYGYYDYEKEKYVYTSYKKASSVINFILE
ncbi:MAG: carboxypeptidase-like regulatory domain-containing protein [Bacteroidota bacterium]|nr:carboxypeptidase-like regulatory domain-containing protein [Bacteroidota bacterium]